MGVLDGSEQVAVDEPHVCLVQVMALSPDYVFHLMLLGKRNIAVIDVLVQNEVLVGQD
jgi:hypothetical protein